MPKNDYFRIVYRILNTLYEYMRKGLTANPDAISAKVLGIEYGYRNQVLMNLLEDGYIKGVRVVSYFGGETASGYMAIEDINDIAITTRGMEYLKDNAMMKNVYQFLKGVKEIIPGV